MGLFWLPNSTTCRTVSFCSGGYNSTHDSRIFLVRKRDLYFVTESEQDSLTNHRCPMAQHLLISLRREEAIEITPFSTPKEPKKKRRYNNARLRRSSARHRRGHSSYRKSTRR